MKSWLNGIVVIFTLAPAPAFATNYWVSPTGGSGDCSSATGDIDPGVYLPSIADGLACVGPAGSESGAGQTVILKDGVYDEIVIDQIPSGASDDARFTLMAENIGGAMLQPTGSARSILYAGIDTHYVTIDGLVLDGANTPISGVTFSSYNDEAFHDIRLSQLEIKNTDMDGMYLQSGTRFEILSNWVHDGGACSQDEPGQCHGMYMAENFRDSIVDANVIDHYQGYAIHFNDNFAGTIAGNLVSNNLSHDNGSPWIGEGSILIWGPGNEIYNNASYENVGPGFHIGYAENYIHDNVAWANGESGVCDISGGATIVNNILIENATGPITPENSSADSDNITSGTAGDYFVNAPAGNFTPIQ